MKQRIINEELYEYCINCRTKKEQLIELDCGIHSEYFCETCWKKYINELKLYQKKIFKTDGYIGLICNLKGLSEKECNKESKKIYDEMLKIVGNDW